MRRIVTSEPGTTTEERWLRETPYLVEYCGPRLAIGPHTHVLDYGCGVGRVAKGLIERYGCRIIGVDFSPSMRLLAPDYVLSERFTVWSVATLDKMIDKGFRADAAICIWVIQHALDVQDTVDRLARSLRPGSRLYALNSGRCVPIDRGWADDGFDVPRAPRTAFLEDDGLPIARKCEVVPNWTTD